VGGDLIALACSGIGEQAFEAMVESVAAYSCHNSGRVAPIKSLEWGREIRCQFDD
jgi:hypothetical protein